MENFWVGTTFEQIFKNFRQKLPKVTEVVRKTVFWPKFSKNAEISLYFSKNVLKISWTVLVFRQNYYWLSGNFFQPLFSTHRYSVAQKNSLPSQKTEFLKSQIALC